jgi:hypothetical protein
VLIGLSFYEKWNTIAKKMPKTIKNGHKRVFFIFWIFAEIDLNNTKFCLISMIGFIIYKKRELDIVKEAKIDRNYLNFYH